MAFPETYESIIKEENLSDGGYVQMEWNDTEGAPIAAGTACPIDGDYLLFSTYWPSQQSAYSYRYAPKFLHRLAQLDYLPFYFKTKAVTGTDSDGNVEYEDVVLSTYPYTGNIQTIAAALAECLSGHGDLGAWTSDTSGLSSSVIQSIRFDGATVKSAAASIADAFGVDYQFIWGSHTIKFGAFDMEGSTPGYGTAQIVENGTENAGVLVSATDGGIQYNTFRILGGTRNMSKKTIKGQNVQVTQRLMLDGDSILGGGSPRFMKDLVFDDIYPKMELWLYDVHERRCWLTDENGKKIVDSQTTNPETGAIETTYKQYSKWYFKLAYWNGSELVPYVFDTSLIIEGLPLSLVFQPNYADGALPQPLVGREFELTYFDAASPAREKEADDTGDGYQPVHGEYRIIYKVEGGMILPSTSAEKACPYGGGMDLRNNKVTLTNVAMDDVYKAAAKAELLRAGQDAVRAYTRDKSSFTYVTYGAAPSLGGGITSVRQDLITGEVQYTVGNYQNSKGLIGRLSDKIDTIQAGGGSATAGDESGGGGRGGVSESSIPMLSRLMGSGSVVKDSLTILKELILGTTGHGIFIDQNGDASMTIGSLTVLGTTHLNEIDVNHIKHTGGLLVVTKANIIVDHVEHLAGGLDKLCFRRVDGNGQRIYNQFEVGDLALMMVYNEALDGSINRYFWREVSAIDDGTEEFGYITLLPSSASHSEPREGDVVVQLGNTSKAERQGATVLGGSGPNGGFFAVYDGFNTWRDAAPQLDDYANALTYISPKKNKITGDFMSIAGDDLNEQLDALRASLLSVSQQSDKQLVIWYGDDDAPLPNSSDLDHWNDPAKDWHDADEAAGDTAQQELHLEDVYYLRRNNTTRKGGLAWQWTYDTALGKFLWVEITDADTIAALEAADDAVETANEARQKVENLGDNGILSGGTEKSELLMMWQDTVAEYQKLIEQARDYDLDDAQDSVEGGTIIYTPYNAYKNRYHVLALMLNGNDQTNIDSIESGNAVPAWLESLNADVKLSDYSLTAADYRDTWKDYFEGRANLLKAIEVAAREKTEHAQADATNALNQIGDMGSDKKLDPSEKLTVKREFLTAWRERDSEGGLLDRCTDANGQYINDTIEAGFVNPYTTAFLAVATYLNGSNGTWTDAPYPVANQDDYIPLWLHSERMNTTEAIDGDTWRNLWSAFYAARTALLTALSDDAKDRADNAQDTADNKKRVFSTAANELPPAPYDVGDLWVNAVWYTEKDGVRTFKWTGDVLYCVYGRSSDANRSINDWSDAASGTTAKIANLGTQIEAEVRDRKNGTSSLLKLDPESGSLTVNVYDAATNSWSSIGNIELALVRGTNGIFSKLNLTADNVEVNASLVSVIASTLEARADLLDFKGGTVKIDAENINFSGQSVSMRASDTLTLSGGTIDLTGSTVKLAAGNVDFSTGTFALTGKALTFSGGTIDLTGSTVKLAAGNVDFSTGTFALTGKTLTFSGGTIDLTASTLKMNANQITYSGQTVDLTAAAVCLNADQLTYSGRAVDLTAATVKLNAGQLTYSGQTIDLTAASLSLNASQIDFTGTDFTISAERINFKTGSFKIDNGTYDSLAVTAAGDVTVRGTINAEAGYFKGELQGATGTFAGSLTSNDNKVLLTSTGISVYGLSYSWRGLAVSNNGFQSGDLATIGARYDVDGYDYGRIALVKRPTGTYTSNNADVNIILSASDGSISASSLSVSTASIGTVNAANIVNTGRILFNGSVIGHVLNNFTPASGNNTISLTRGSRVLVNGTYGTVYLPELTSCRAWLGLDSNTHFAIDLIVMAASGSSFTVYGYVKAGYGDDCPHIRNNDEYQDTTGGIKMAQGDILHLVLVYDGTWNAFIISHRE